MYLTQKKSVIKNWWVARVNDKMGFVNILEKKNISNDLIVIGTWDRELSTSTNKVVKVTKEGVTTAKGTFYPFTEANEVYLQYLIDVNREDIIIAKAWEWKNKKRIVANVLQNKIIIPDCEFDFTPYENSTGVYVSGYSEELKSVVVLNPFNEGTYCMKLKIPQNIKDKINKGCQYLDMEKVTMVETIFKKKC